MKRKNNSWYSPWSLTATIDASRNRTKVIRVAEETTTNRNVYSDKLSFREEGERMAASDVQDYRASPSTGLQ